MQEIVNVKARNFHFLYAFRKIRMTLDVPSGLLTHYLTEFPPTASYVYPAPLEAGGERRLRPCWVLLAPSAHPRRPLLSCRPTRWKSPIQAKLPFPKIVT